MGEQEQSATLHVARELAGDIAEILTDEWNSRTKLGQALYPFWVVESTMQWLTVLFFLGVMVIANAFVETMSKPSALPIYKEKE